MSRTGSSELFDLIHSLTKAEKAHLKLFAGKGKKSEVPVYVKLFDLMERQEEYNEQKILVGMKDFSAPRLAVLKNYLYDLILSSLELLHADDSTETELRHTWLKADILFRKGLYSQSEKLFGKAKKMAKEQMRFVHYLDILGKEKAMMLFTSFANTSIEKLDEIFSETFSTLEMQKNFEEYLYMQNILLLKLNHSSDVVKSKEEVKEAEAFMANDLLSDERKATSLRSKLLFHNIHYLYNDTFSQNYKNGNEHSVRYIELIESEPTFIRENPNDYVAGLNNLIITYFRIGQYEKAKQGILKMRSFQDDFDLKLLPALKAKIFVRSCNLEVAVFSYSGEFELLEGVIEVVEEGLKKYKRILNRSSEMSIVFNVSSLLFITGEYKRSLEWINRIINKRENTVRMSTVCEARMFSLMIHFEMGNFELLPYLAKSVERFILKHRKLYQVEKLLLAFFSKAASLSGNKEKLHQNFVALKKEIEITLRDPLEEILIQSLDISLWVDSKVAEKNMVTLSKERMKK